MSYEACMVCRFWEKNKGTDLMGVCHRFPPVYTGRGDSGDPSEQPSWMAFDQPAVAAVDWCGEFQERPVEAEQQAEQ